MDCNDFHEPMVDMLYGEASEEDVRTVEQHLAACATCREEFSSLRAVRRHMSAWKVPLFPRRSLQRPPSLAGPLWRLAAAATLILAAGGALGLSGVEIQYGNGPWSIRLGRGKPAVIRAETIIPVRSPESAQSAENAIEELRAALRAESAMRADALQRRVERIIHESEARQTMACTASLTDLRQNFETQRRYDLARITAGLSYLEGKSGAQTARTTELMGYMLQASQRREP